MKNKYFEFIDVSLYIGLITFFIVYVIASLLQNDGYNLVETSLLSVLTGFIMFFVILIFNIILTRKKIKKEKQHFNKYYIVFFVLIFSVLTFISIDSLVWLFDDSISLDFAEGLKQLIENSEELKSLDEFSKLPFSIQNSLSTIVFGFLGSLFSLIFIKNKVQEN